MRRRTLTSVADLRWPAVGAFVGVLAAGLLYGLGVVEAVVVAFALTGGGLALAARSLRGRYLRNKG
jgi:uncharacterized membrane protein